MNNNTSSKKKGTAMILCAIGLFGPAGLHEFYLGRAGWGIIKFITWNFIWIGTIIDLIRLGSGSYKDSDGKSITIN